MREKKSVDQFFSEEIEVNGEGGGQSKVKFRFDLLDPYAMFALADVMRYGAERYAPDNWRLIDCDTHINHAVGHIYEYMKNRDMEALTHAFARLMMAVATADEGGASAQVDLLPITDFEFRDAVCRRD